MALTDDELLDFDHDRLAHFVLEDAKRTLSEQGEVFRSQLVAARWIEGWAKTMAKDAEPGNLRSAEYEEGVQYPLAQVGAHLRQGDLVPGGVLYDDTAGRPA